MTEERADSSVSEVAYRPGWKSSASTVGYLTHKPAGQVWVPGVGSSGSRRLGLLGKEPQQVQQLAEVDRQPARWQAVAAG